MTVRELTVNLGKVFVVIPPTTVQRPNAQHPRDLIPTGFRTPKSNAQHPQDPWIGATKAVSDAWLCAAALCKTVASPHSYQPIRCLPSIPIVRSIASCSTRGAEHFVGWTAQHLHTAVTLSFKLTAGGKCGGRNVAQIFGILRVSFPNGYFLREPLYG